jgi:small multidrug resistance pump
MATAYVYLSVAIVAEVIATGALRAAEGFTVLLPSAISVVGYVVAFYFLSLTLKTMPVGIAYAIWSGVGIVLISLVGWLVYKQLLDLPAIIGMTLIMAGVVVINLWSRTVVH